MNTPILKPSERLKVVDSLRGFALLAIVLLHNLEPVSYTHLRATRQWICADGACVGT